MTQTVEPVQMVGAFVRVFPVCSPTLPPATHTNTYIVGDGATGLAIVDAASPYPEERARLDQYLDELTAKGARVEAVVITHHHLDHISGSQYLADRFGVPLYAHPRTKSRLEELGVEHTRVTQVIEDDEIMPFGDGLRAIFTPGHAPGHLSFVEQSSGALLCGDMVASIGTIIIEPDDYGDMGQYLESLARLRREMATALLPAHGPVLFDAAVDEKLNYYITHRKKREAMIADALTAAPQTLEQLVPLAYPEISPKIYFLAERSLLAHLQKLEKEKRALSDASGWRRA